MVIDRASTNIFTGIRGSRKNVCGVEEGVSLAHFSMIELAGLFCVSACLVEIMIAAVMSVGRKSIEGHVMLV